MEVVRKSRNEALREAFFSSDDYTTLSTAYLIFCRGTKDEKDPLHPETRHPADITAKYEYEEQGLNKRILEAEFKRVTGGSMLDKFIVIASRTKNFDAYKVLKELKEEKEKAEDLRARAARSRRPSSVPPRTRAPSLYTAVPPTTEFLETLLTKYDGKLDHVADYDPFVVIKEPFIEKRCHGFEPFAVLLGKPLKDIDPPRASSPLSFCLCLIIASLDKDDLETKKQIIGWMADCYMDKTKGDSVIEQTKKILNISDDRNLWQAKGDLTSAPTSHQTRTGRAGPVLATYSYADKLRIFGSRQLSPYRIEEAAPTYAAPAYFATGGGVGAAYPPHPEPRYQSSYEGETGASFSFHVSPATLTPATPPPAARRVLPTSASMLASRPQFLSGDADPIPFDIPPPLSPILPQYYDSPSYVRATPPAVAAPPLPARILKANGITYAIPAELQDRYDAPAPSEWKSIILLAAATQKSHPKTRQWISDCLADNVKAARAVAAICRSIGVTSEEEFGAMAPLLTKAISETGMRGRTMAFPSRTTDHMESKVAAVTRFVASELEAYKPRSRASSVSSVPGSRISGSRASSVTRGIYKY